ncbi:SseB family protein [Streptomyces sp. NPDC058572]|uniref:SseB family protein n=1 Tax=Streptomyces sp. NPDC058572 TaxID=3346546 RepID=UPI003651C1FE
MADHGDETTRPEQRSKLADLADPPPEGASLDTPLGAPLDSASPEAHPVAASDAEPLTPDDQLAMARREFAALLGEFRRTAVLVPFDAYGSLWTADHGGVRWICAFSDEEALADFAQARGEAEREWTYRTVLGARLLDVMVPMLSGPAGVALDAGSDGGMLFPPVTGIVPDAVAVDLGGTL